MSDASVAALRRFNRFYTKQIGILDEGLLQSPFSLAEVRLLYEIANGKDVSAVQLADALGLDPGYLSRILRRFQKHGLVRRETSAADGRRTSTPPASAAGSRSEAERSPARYFW